MARFGDEDRKSREAFQQHNGIVVGTMKWLSKKVRNFLGMLNPFGGY